MNVNRRMQMIILSQNVEQFKCRPFALRMTNNQSTYTFQFRDNSDSTVLDIMGELQTQRTKESSYLQKMSMMLQEVLGRKNVLIGQTSDPISVWTYKMRSIL